RVVKVVIDANTDLRAYVAVAANGANTTGAVYKTEDGGLTWVNVLNPATMFLAAGGTVGGGTALASVTDLIIDPFNSDRLVVGLGTTGLWRARSAAGLGRTTNRGASWDQIVGGASLNPPAPALPVPNSTLPTGTNLGRVTLAMGSGRVGDERFVYVL